MYWIWIRPTCTYPWYFPQVFLLQIRLLIFSVVGLESPHVYKCLILDMPAPSQVLHIYNFSVSVVKEKEMLGPWM